VRNTILVTGGAGYIGSHTCKALHRAGYTPIVYDNLVYGHRWAVKWGPLEVGDIHDAAHVAEVCDRYCPVAAIHFAAYAYVGESVVSPRKYYNNNVVGSLALIDTLSKRKIPLVFSSTCATYGTPERLPISETTPQNPINPYGCSKLMIEQILKDYDTAYGMKSVCLRYFNAAGADRDGEIGEMHCPETHVIPLALRATDANKPLMVFGLNYDTRDGSAVRDYVHVEDLAAAHLAALKHLLVGGQSERINVGTGVGSTVLEVIRAVESVSGRKVGLLKGARRAGDPQELVADPARMQQVLKLDPKGFQSLKDIVSTAWVWEQNSLKIANKD
jgi:UDP-arabinose 4-epimerase